MTNPHLIPLRTIAELGDMTHIHQAYLVTVGALASLPNTTPAQQAHAALAEVITPHLLHVLMMHFALNPTPARNIWPMGDLIAPMHPKSISHMVYPKWGEYLGLIERHHPCTDHRRAATRVLDSRMSGMTVREFIPIIGASLTANHIDNFLARLEMTNHE